LDTIELPGYIFKMKNRKKIPRKSGGMILAYKESLENYIELLDIESKYALWFKVSSKLVNLNEDVIFGNVYIPQKVHLIFNQILLIK
jgi:tRNA-binding EMAP/Myf-like protein